jgi:hypothetical protein
VLKKPCIIFLFLFVLSASSHPLFAEPIKGRVGIGLGFPYLSLKYGITHQAAFELRCAYMDGILVAGGRLYYNINPQRQLVGYITLEGDYISFRDVEGLSGSGYIFAIFFGGELFASRSVSITGDIGPAYISIKDNDTGASVNPIQFVANLGINLYF